MFKNNKQNKTYVCDKLNNSYYYFGVLHNIIDSIPYLPFYNFSTNADLTIQWRFNDPYNDIHRSINSETIITDIEIIIIEIVL